MDVIDFETQLSRHGERYYWKATRRQRELGFVSEALGTDKNIAFKRAAELTKLVREKTRTTVRAKRRRMGITRIEITTHEWLLLLGRVCRNTRASALRRQLNFTLELADLVRMYERQGGRCAVTGVRFAADTAGTDRRRPFMPSVDRVDCTRGYEPGNCRLVAVAANYAMQAWGEAVLREMALSMATSGTQNIDSPGTVPSAASPA
jgi:hypothetical protein